MKIEEIPNNELSFQEEAGSLLKKLPQELALRWEKKLSENKQDPKEIVAALKEIIAEREKDAKQPFANFLSEEERVYDDKLDQNLRERTVDLIKLVAQEARDGKINTIGEGQTAKVATSKIDDSFCYKSITDPKKYSEGNSVKKEMEFLDELTSDEIKKTGVIVPRPYYYQMGPQAHVCVMERLDLTKVAEIVDGLKPLPQNFNFESFFHSLNNFISTMHSKGIYHRDLHGGNVLIDNKTGAPCVLDFGSAKKGSLNNENEVYQEIDSTTGKTTKFVEDEVMIKKHEREIKKILNN